MKHWIWLLMVLMLALILFACGGGGGGAGVTLSSISVSPANPSIIVEATQQFTATGMYSDGSTHDITAQVTWVSGTGSIATINSSGLATGVSSGTSTITATLGSLSKSTILTVEPQDWTWVSGSNEANQSGIYGTKGTAAPANIPGARYGAISWIDSKGNFWLFGGAGYDSNGSYSYLNDLWKYDGTNWTWVSGSNIVNQQGTYGIQGTPASSNIPGARCFVVSWIDSQDNLWLFGGYGMDSTGSMGYLNDLWKYDGTNWTWVSGSNFANQLGNYGTQGKADPANVPGARYQSSSWIDSKGNLWLFGGFVHDLADSNDLRNDLWKYDGTNWTWVSGSNTCVPIGNSCGQLGNYGTQGKADPANVPGARHDAMSWIDSKDNLWLFGGDGYGNPTAGGGYLNDLWKYDGTNWTWVSGGTKEFLKGIYGTQGTPASSNVPGGKEWSASWIDSKGNFWLFGGYSGFDSAGHWGFQNDLWKYDGTNWTWVSGSNTVNQQGTYGIQGTPASSNIPGARSQAVSWIDSKGNLWLFGGWGYDPTVSAYFLNDLWKYAP